MPLPNKYWWPAAVTTKATSKKLISLNNQAVRLKGRLGGY